ncbi:MAG: sensor histidine kinase, partial [Tagaea sp.]
LESAHGLLALIDGVIELSSLSGGGAPYPAAPAAIDEAVAGALAGAEVAAKARDIALVAAVEPDLPSLRCERTALRRMLDPLVANAIKFGRAGGTATVTAARAEGGGVRLVVADDGMGIAPEDIAHCLEPFGQVENGLARRHGGIGLGLALVKAQAEAHGGTLALESRKGAFTRVTIVFPPGRIA